MDQYIVEYLRGSVPRLFNTPLKIGDIRILNSRNDILLVTSGICTEEALRARAAIIECRYLNFTCMFTH